MSFLNFLLGQHTSQPHQQSKQPQHNVVGDFLGFLTHATNAIANPGGEIATHPQQTAKVATAARDTGVSAVRSVPRTAASILLSTGAVPSDVQDNKGTKELQPASYKGLARTILGSEPISGVTGEGAKVAKSFGASDTAAKKIGTVAGVPLAALGLFISPGNVGKSAALEALSKASTAEEAISALGKVKNLNLSAAQIKKVAPAIAGTADKNEINQILTQAVQGSKKAAPKVADLNKGVNQANTEATRQAALNGELEHARLDQPRPLQVAKDYSANKLPTDATPDTTVTVYRAAVPGQSISAGDHISLSEAGATKYTQRTPGLQLTKEQVPLRDLVGSGGTKNEFVYAPKAPVEDYTNVTDKLIQQGKLYDRNLTPSDRLRETLVGSNTATEKVKPFAWLNKLKDTSGVAGDYFGKVGTDTVSQLAKGAKTVADIQEKTQPLLQDSQKLLGKIAGKSKAARSEVQSRIFQALEDRPNAEQYLKSDQEKQLYGIVQQVLDGFKAERESRGLGTLENYGPRTAVQDALQAPDRILSNVRAAFSTNAESAFSKERVLDEAAHNVDHNIVDLLPRYVSSQAREFGYKPALDYFAENYKNVDPAYLTNGHNVREGERYLQTLFQDVLNPSQAGKVEQFLNRRLQTTYKSSLSFSPRFALQNRTQRFVTNTEVTRKAKSASKAFTDEQKATLRSGLTSGENAITGEIGTLDTGKAPGKFAKLDPGQKVEKGNIHDAFDRGAAQYIIKTDGYKQAIKEGASKQEAIDRVLKDGTVQDEMTGATHLDLAQRAGNTVVNDTQFGANIVNKPEWFREGGMQYLIPKKFFQQYQRFSTGMIQNIARSFGPTRARELDILRRGDPRETQLVDFSRATKALVGATKDAISGIKSGHITDVSLEDAKSYLKQLTLAQKQLDAGIKQSSTFRSGKNIRNIAKMWAASSAVQFLFDGGQHPGRDVRQGAPFNVPSSGRDISSSIASVPGVAVPALPQNNRQIVGKALNFVPGVGIAYNRGRDISKFFKTLTGGQ